MGVINPSITRNFINTVKLPVVPKLARAVATAPPVELKETEAQSLVVGSGLVVAAAKVPVQTREDLINCTLFAQLAASGTVNASRTIQQWYDAYFKALTTLGWAQSDTRFENYEFNRRNAEAHESILKVLAVLLGPAATALVVVKAAIEALQSMKENSTWLTLFERRSTTGRSARFQVATAQLDESALLQTALVGFELNTKSTLTQVLFFRFSTSSTTLRYAAGKATIYEAALADQRTVIAQRLAAYRAAYVRQVKFPPPQVAP